MINFEVLGFQTLIKLFPQFLYLHIDLNLFIIPDFGVSSVILITTDISRRWCKLNFEPLRSHVKSIHLSDLSGKWIDLTWLRKGDNIFTFLI